MKWEEIPHRIRDGSYEVNIPLGSVIKTIKEWQDEDGYNLVLNPDFQRGHVWDEKQQVEFMEYFLSGGVSGRVIYFNHPTWSGQAVDGYVDFVCVDGLQRVTAMSRFMTNEIKAFGQYRCEFGERILCKAANNLKFNINSLKTKSEVLHWYIQMNSGGTPHTNEEIEKVKMLLKVSE